MMRSLLAAGVGVIIMITMSLAAADESASNAAPSKTASAVFAGGCFWCVEADFEKVSGVLDAVSGYTGGDLANPTYKQVSSNTTGHAEAVRVTYDPDVVTYEELLRIFWRNVDPFDAGGQFCDRGSSYRAEIFVADEGQRKAAETSRALLEERFDEVIVTRVTDLGFFYLAEDYHQDYYKKNAVRYRIYRAACGRDGRLEEIWGEES